MPRSNRLFQLLCGRLENFQDTQDAKPRHTPNHVARTFFVAKSASAQLLLLLHQAQRTMDERKYLVHALSGMLASDALEPVVEYLLSFPHGESHSLLEYLTELLGHQPVSNKGNLSVVVKMFIAHFMCVCC